MRRHLAILTAAAAWILAGCSSPEPGKRTASPKSAVEDPAPAITQFYSTVPKVARGETALICYGVENARAVWLEPPRQELSVALTRCVEVSPDADTTYKLTAEGAEGKTATREVTVAVGAGRAKIVNVTVSAIEVHAGDLVNLCWETANATAVNVAPMGFRGLKAKGCVSDQPRKSTTYVVTATGAGGDRDEEKVEVKVR